MLFSGSTPSRAPARCDCSRRRSAAGLLPRGARPGRRSPRPGGRSRGVLTRLPERPHSCSRSEERWGAPGPARPAPGAVPHGRGDPPPARGARARGDRHGAASVAPGRGAGAASGTSDLTDRMTDAPARSGGSTGAGWHKHPRILHRVQKRQAPPERDFACSGACVRAGVRTRRTGLEPATTGSTVSAYSA